MKYFCKKYEYTVLEIHFIQIYSKKSEKFIFYGMYIIYSLLIKAFR